MSRRLRVQITAESPDCIPGFATEHAAGMDLKANEDCLLEPAERKAIGTGIRLAIPHGFEAQVRPRSGLALNTGLFIPNAPGTIDSDYRGEVKVLLANLGATPVRIARGDRIAQLVISPVLQVEWEQVAELAETERADGGFGSTGTGG